MQALKAVAQFHISRQARRTLVIYRGRNSVAINGAGALSSGPEQKLTLQAVQPPTKTKTPRVILGAIAYRSGVLGAKAVTDCRGVISITARGCPPAVPSSSIK